MKAFDAQIILQDVACSLLIFFSSQNEWTKLLLGQESMEKRIAEYLTSFS